MGNIGRSGLLFGFIVCLCCCVEVESVSCSNGAGYCDYSWYIQCYINNSDTQLVKELIRDCSNSGTNLDYLLVYKDYVSNAHGDLTIEIELHSNIKKLYIYNRVDDFQIVIRTFTENTALTNLFTYNNIILESKDVFNNFTSLQQIYIGKIWSTELPSFTKLQLLTYLYIRLGGSDSERHTFDETFVGGLSNLVTLSLSNSYMNGVTTGAFRNLTQLTELNIGNNGMSYIEDGAFTDLIRLKKLEIYGNPLTSIPNNIFEGLSELTHLAIKLLELLPFLQTRNLVELKLYYINTETILRPYVFQQMNSLTSLKLSGLLTCDCELQWVSVLSQYGIDIQGSPVCHKPTQFYGRNIYDTTVYSECSQTQTYHCFNKSITCPGNQVCENTNDSYTCDCAIGYAMNSSGNCVDINECDNEINCQQSCMNTEGSYSCICDKGHQLASNGYDCDDVNECLEWNGGCEDDCVNTVGSYQCHCHDGRQLYNQTHCQTNIECDVIDNGYSQNNSFVCQGGFIVTITNITCDPYVQPTAITETIPSTATTETIPATSATDCPFGYVQRSTGECVMRMSVIYRICASIHV